MDTLYPTVKGRDGASAVPMPINALDTTVLQGVPQCSVLTTRCDHCGTSDVAPTKPGAITYAFVCRSCDRINPVQFFIFDFFVSHCFN